MADRDGDGWEDENDPDPDRASEYHDYYGSRRPRPPAWGEGEYGYETGEEGAEAQRRAMEEWENANAADDAENDARNARRGYTARGGDPHRLPPGHPDRVAAERAEANARWDAMSWEERQAARGRGETRDGGAGGGGGGDGMGGGGGGFDFDSAVEGIPFLDSLSGAEGRRGRTAAEAEARRRAGILGDLAEFMPSEDELSTEYRHEGRVGPGAESLQARDAFAEWSEGGFTDADRAMMDSARRASGMTARANREADMSALEARGMGGSGGTLAAMLSAGEGAADRNADTDATMMGAAQRRQYDATGALGAWGAREDDYSRGLEGRNTGYDHRTAESASEAAQTAHENRERHTSFATGGDPNAAGNRASDDEDRAEDMWGGLAQGLASLI